ncbi:NRDE family protein [Aestuariibaculum sediminum]|uniref:NRDE family protein n=1 Tax=Aestuariibaculum sediminum TaxID=2770637 RepID=A0A8J6QI27_9FLAO|nr:NRDE family protein [Aestuariibaculum sediminum]MBD0832434.1 NRDE family protein [Aestuariibaculum sediminum]
MCTVTLVPIGEHNFVLTSNRDEAPERISFPPKIYSKNNTKLLFPKDKQSGGTWVGVSEFNRVVCVLNGGFDLHERKTSYRLSRGIVALDVLSFEFFKEEIKQYNLNDIEPFTMIIVDWTDGLSFYELVWDGVESHLKSLPLKEHIWSSTTLYTDVMKKERCKWFDAFVSESELTSKSILEFHKVGGDDSSDYGVVMNRGFVKTTSITQIEKLNHGVVMYYENLQNNASYLQTFKLPQTVDEE